MAEYAQVSVSIRLPEALINLLGGSRGSENAQTHSITVHPVAFERTSVLPNQLAVPTLLKNVVDHRVVALLLPILLLAFTLLIACTCRYLTCCINGDVTSLAHVAERAKIESLKLELTVFDAQLLVVGDRLVLLCK